MDYLGAIMSGISSIFSMVSFVIFAAGVMKVFQMATTLTEIKEELTKMKFQTSIPPVETPIAATQPLAPSVPHLPMNQSGEEMLRALSLELDQQPINPTSIELGHKS